ncbi:MAG: alkaline phosphatase family protein, partial [Candidatus Kapabacteria bacterium]|nr:alkaline phosphatase family protein [Candidatus Kapabacteria bacterium]
MMKIHAIILCILTALFAIPLKSGEKPKLIVVIAYDQLRGDRLDAVKDDLTDGGFLRLIKQGKSYANCSFKHANCMTGPGHAT